MTVALKNANQNTHLLELTLEAAEMNALDFPHFLSSSVSCVFWFVFVRYICTQLTLNDASDYLRKAPDCSCSFATQWFRQVKLKPVQYSPFSTVSPMLGLLSRG